MAGGGVTDSVVSGRGSTEGRTTLVLGAGGTGRSHRLRELASPTAAWLSASPRRPVDGDAVRHALANQPSSLVIDDAQWCSEEALDLLADAVGRLTVLASMRPFPASDGSRSLIDVMSSVGDVERLDRLDEAGIAAVVSGITGRASSSELIDQLLVVTGGVAGLVADAVSTGFTGDLDVMPDQTAAAIVARVERAGPVAMYVLELAALDVMVGRSVGVHAAVLDDPDQAEQAARASGALGVGGSCTPIVRVSIRHALTSQRRRERHDQLARLLLVIDPAAAAEHLLSGTRALPDQEELFATAVTAVAVSDATRCLDLLERAAELGPITADLTVVEATAAYWAGRHDVLGRLDPPADAKQIHRDQLAELGFGIDVRDLRWDSAGERPVAEDLRDLAAACVGTSQSGEVSERSIASRLTAGLSAVMAGRADEGLERLVMVADDADRGSWTVPVGITPHAVAALAAIWLGDLSAAGAVLDQAVALASGGEGERRTHGLLSAYVGLLGGRSGEALAAVEAGDEPTWPQRDRLLVAALDAAIARRSGDTQRLRDAWSRSEFALLRPASSWLLFDPVLELLAAGTRIGDDRRVKPVAAALTEQLAAMPAGGAGPVAEIWLELQLGLAARNDAAVRSAADALSGADPSDPRGLARSIASRQWADLASGTIDEQAAMTAMDALVPVGDGWEASRILGQTALDHPDPRSARRLLEAARSLSNDPTDDRGNDGLVALGLSEREAEVAVLVTEGKTHREVGSTLFISPKTVEHHVAKIRQKLGTATRADMMAMVRQATSGDDR